LPLVAIAAFPAEFVEKAAVAPEDQKTIVNFKIDDEQLSYPNAHDPNA